MQKNFELESMEHLCPQCAEPVHAGHVVIHGTFWGFIWVGWSLQHLWFRPRDGKEHRLIYSGDSRRAWQCPACGMVLIPNAPTG